MEGDMKTILLVEDEEQVLKLVVKVLEMNGYQVLKAASSLQAVLVSDAFNGDIDLLLTDVELDHNMNGCELATIIRRSRPGVRVLYTSGYPLETSHDHEGYTVRMEIQELLAGYIPKPFTPAALAEKVHGTLKGLPV